MIDCIQLALLCKQEQLYRFSLFSLLAAGHMALVNLGFGWWSETVGVRPLLVIPGLIWVGVFLLAGAGLENVRLLLREGSFGSSMAAPAAVSGGGD